ncbi:nucleoside transporter C-terminal domain-containing protein [Herbaspirillum lusitanum]|uniref:Nucleoside transporter C-terminal domain-containing protein n=1 Tax=Herbaspirillum lusitanum TaxID=213312 RepID=A0ABW9A961_9BURK
MSILKALISIALLLLLAYALSPDRRRIAWRTVLLALLLQSLLFIVISYIPPVRAAFFSIGAAFTALLDFAGVGAHFLLGNLTSDNFGLVRNAAGEVSLGTVVAQDSSEQLKLFDWIYAFKVFPILIFFAALTSVLYHFGILQKLVAAMAWLMRRSMRLSGVESLATAGNLFLGMSESPLLVRPYLKHMTQSELACLLIGAMSLLAGSTLGAYVGLLGGDNPVDQARFASMLILASFMNAPAAIIFAKILFPENPQHLAVAISARAGMSSSMHASDSGEGEDTQEHGAGRSLMTAIVDGAMDGVKMCVASAAILIAIISLIALLNALTRDLAGELLGVNAWIRTSSGGVFDGLTFQYLFGQIMRVVAFMIGVSWSESLQVGSLLGTKIVINEFVAYIELTRMRTAGQLSQHAVFISTFALSSFSNFGTVGIMTAGISALAPSQRDTLGRIGLRCLLGAVLAGFLTASTAAMWTSLAN